MTRAIRCDRCKKMEEASMAYPMGISSFYIGKVQEYSMGEMPDIRALDLCGKCQIKLDGVVAKFMKEAK